MFTVAIKVAAATVLSVMVGVAGATSFPERPITLITPFPAGGATDGLARTLSDHMAKTLGQAVVVENRAGAATTIGASHAVRSKPDGYTIFLATNSTLVTNRFLFKDLNYDPDAFEPIGMIGIGPMVLLTSKKHQYQSLADVVEAAKAQPGSLSIASFGSGTSSHLAAEYFQQLADVELLHVPFKGSSQALPQLIGGDVDLFFDMVSTGMPQVESDNVDVQAITSRERMSTLPDLPTVSESGYADFEMTAWFTLVAPPGTPQAQTDKVRDALKAALSDDTVRERMFVMGIEPSDGSPEALVRQVEQEMPIIGSLIERADIVVQ